MPVGADLCVRPSVLDFAGIRMTEKRAKEAGRIDCSVFTAAFKDSDRSLGGKAERVEKNEKGAIKKNFGLL